MSEVSRGAVEARAPGKRAKTTSMVAAALAKTISMMAAALAKAGRGGTPAMVVVPAATR
jgi:hypothetical protein